MSVDNVFLPPISPYVLPETPFDQLIQAYGIRMQWLRSHSCPCVYGNGTIGSPDPQCQTCQGRGIYWDAPSAIFTGLLTWVHVSRTPDEPGFFTHGKVGVTERGEPTITIPYGASDNIWTNASVFDAYIETDSTARYSANLQVGGITAIPYQNGLSIAATGAVTIYNTTTHEVQSVSGYTVSGANVILPNTYPENTSYNVEFTAQPVYVAYATTSAPHVRPFGIGTLGSTINNLPRRFLCNNLDLWLRARQYPGSSSPQGL